MTNTTPYQSPQQAHTALATTPFQMPPGVYWLLTATIGILFLVNLACLAFLERPKTVPEPEVSSSGQSVSPPSRGNTNVKPTPTQLVVKDNLGKFQVNLTSDWSIQTDPSARLFAINLPDDVQLVVFNESKNALRAIDPRYVEHDAYASLLRDQLLKVMQNGSSGKPQQIKINGLAAVQCEVTGTMKELHLKFLHTVIETPEEFYQVRLTTTAARFDELRPRLVEIANSFRLIETP